MSDSRPRSGQPGGRREIELFAEIEIEDYVDNRPLIEALRASEVSAQATIGRLNRQLAASQRKCEVVVREFTEMRVANEHAGGEAKARIGRLEQALTASQEQISELRHQSAVAVVVAWVGAVLVGLGVNLITGQDQKVPGLAVLISGGLVEVAAFFVRRHSSPAPKALEAGEEVT